MDSAQFSQAKLNLSREMANTATKDHPIEGPVTEKGITIRHRLFGVSKSLALETDLVAKLQT